MRQELIDAFSEQGIEIPEKDLLDTESPSTKRAAEKFYSETKIETSQGMSRGISKDSVFNFNETVLEKLCKLVGIEEAEILKARVTEKAHILAELRSHDALAKMIKKIGVRVGVVTKEDVNHPLSTEAALAIGIASHSAYGIIKDKASDNGKEVAELKAKLEEYQSEAKIYKDENIKLSAELAATRGKLSASELMSNSIVASDVESKYYISCAEGNQIKFIGWPWAKTNRLTRKPDVKARPYDLDGNYVYFTDIEKAKKVVSWLRKQTKLKYIEDPMSIKLVTLGAVEAR